MKAVIEIKGIEGKTNFFQNGLFFLTFGTIDENTKWLHSLCGYKKPFFFQIILLKKHFDKMTISRSSICNFFSKEIPTSGAFKKKWMFKTRKKFVKKKTSDAVFEILSCFDKQKKVSSYERNFLLFLPIKC